MQTRSVEYEGKVIRLSPADCLYVHKCDVRALQCYRNAHHIVPVTAVVSGIDGNEYSLSVRYCVECIEYFISRTSYDLYIERLGFILASFDDYERVFSETNRHARYDECVFQDTSPLSLMGYTVDEKEDIPEAVRHAFLATAMDKGLLTKEVITEYLEQFLRVNAKRSYMDIAEEKWKSDLAFVLQYKANDQPHVFLSAVVEWKDKKGHKMQPYSGKIDIDNTTEADQAPLLSFEEQREARGAGIYDKKRGEIKIVMINNRERVHLYIKVHLNKEALRCLDEHGWEWDAQNKCWYHRHKDYACNFAQAFLAGKTLS